MHTETSKIALACFIGGALCAAVALIVAPNFWWLGWLAGMAGGYICYDIREIRASIPEAWRTVCQLIDVPLGGIIDWLSTSHPFLYPSLCVTAFLSWLWLGNLLLLAFNNDLIIVVVFGSIILCACAFMIGFCLAVFASLGAEHVERCFWIDMNTWHGSDMWSLSTQGCHKMPATYANVTRWFIEGVGVSIWFIIQFFTWKMWKGAWQATCMLARFGCEMFKLVHSHKRVLCTINGTIGGTVSYLWLASTSTTLPEQLLLVAFGGLLGAGLGILNWEIVSRRILGYN